MSKLQEQLKQFTGNGESLFSNPTLPFKYTEGVLFFANETKAGWLLELIASEIIEYSLSNWFLSIKLVVVPGRIVLTVTNGGSAVLYSKELENINFHTGIWRFFLISDILLLSSEFGSDWIVKEIENNH